MTINSNSPRQSAQAKIKITEGQISLFLLCIFFFVLPLSAYKLKILYAYITISVLVMMVVSIHRNALPAKWTPFVVTSMIYVGIPATSLFTSSYPGSTLDALIATGPINLGLAFLASFVPRDRIILAVVFVVKALVIAFFVAAIAIIAMYGSLRPETVQAKASTGSLSNLLAANLVLAAPYLVWAHRERIGSAVWIRVLICVCVLLCLLAMSRSSVVVLFVVFLLMQCIKSKSTVRKFLFATRYVLVTFSLLTFLHVIGGDDAITAKLLSRFGDSQITSNLNITPDRTAQDYRRALMYHEGFLMSMEFWPVGSGFGGLAPYIEDSWGVAVVSHNSIITIVGELGIVGVFSYCCVTGYILLHIYRLRSSSVRLQQYFAFVSGIALFAAFALSMTRPVDGIYLLPILLVFILRLNPSGQGRNSGG